MRTRWAFRLVTIGLSVLVGLLSVEVALSWRERAIAGSDRLDPGLVQHDPSLGWRLTPGWSGRHRHHDFDVRYRVNAEGFRAETAGEPEKGARTVWVLGDSFTFGLGVNDTETFVHLLDQRGRPTRRFVNLAVPGYSTDQELLLLEQQLGMRRAQAVILVVCLVNELFDNQLEVPLQVNGSKPRFEIGSHGLELRNVPVPIAVQVKADFLAVQHIGC